MSHLGVPSPNEAHGLGSGELTVSPMLRWTGAPRLPEAQRASGHVARAAASQVALYPRSLLPPQVPHQGLRNLPELRKSWRLEVAAQEKGASVLAFHQPLHPVVQGQSGQEAASPTHLALQRPAPQRPDGSCVGSDAPHRGKTCSGSRCSRRGDSLRVSGAGRQGVRAQQVLFVLGCFRPLS